MRSGCIGVLRLQSLASRYTSRVRSPKVTNGVGRAAVRNAPYQIGDRTTGENTGENRTASFNSGLGDEGAHQPIGQTTAIRGTDALYFLSRKALLIKAENIAVDAVVIKGRLLG